MSLCLDWQLRASHSSTDLHICNFEEAVATPVRHFFFFLCSFSNLGNQIHRVSPEGRLIIQSLSVFLLLKSFPFFFFFLKERRHVNLKTQRSQRMIDTNSLSSNLRNFNGHTSCGGASKLPCIWRRTVR